MVHPNEILESLRLACSQSEALPSGVTYSTVELDAESQHANIPLPIVEFSIDDIHRDTSRNTEKIGKEYDVDGNEIGYVFQSWFDMEIDATAITASRGEMNHRTLDQQLRKTLVMYDDHTMGHRPPDPDGPGSLSGISYFRVDSIKPVHDFNTSPTMRAREVSVYVDYVHNYLTTDVYGEYDYVEDVELRSPDGFDENGDPVG